MTFIFNMRISTGSLDFDRWLHGGYEQGIITTFYGPAGSGKTNLCIMAAAHQAAKGKKVIFIDTEGGVSVVRLKQIAQGQEVMRNVLLLRATNFSEQLEAFDKLLKLVNDDVGLIIVDSMVMLYRIELSEARKQGQEKQIYGSLAKQMRILNEIAQKKNIPVLITDQVYSEFLSKEDFEAGKPKGVVMVGGDIMRYWSKCIIELKSIGEGRRLAILRKHRSLPEKSFEFRITEHGILRERKFSLF